jgi:2-aminoadipate transaminase
VQAKQGADLHTSTFNQMVAYEVAHKGFLDKHVITIRRVYQERRDAMLDALTEQMPAGVHWTHPQGGLFLWATFPEALNTSDLLKKAVKEKVAFVPGAGFYPCGGGANTMRLNFSFCKPEIIIEGIARLGIVVKQDLNG